VPLDEHVEVHGIEVVSPRVSETRDVRRRDRPRHPIHELRARVRRAGHTVAPRDRAQPLETLGRKRLGHGIANAEKAAPRGTVVRHHPLLHLGERHEGKIDHRLRREEIEVGHRLVRAGDEAVDLIGLTRQLLVVAYQLVHAGHTPALRCAFEDERDSFHGSEAPGDSRREEGIDEGERVRHEHKSLSGGARQAMLHELPKADGH